ncbi:arabinan endo-1,5-alpha-L-arabinosidase [Streptomyces sp. NPDC054796]
MRILSARRRTSNPSGPSGRSRRRRRATLVGAPLAAAVLGTVIALVPGTASAAYPGPGVVTGDIGIHDPSMAKVGSGYVLYGSNNRLDARTSPDRTAFKNAGSAFSQPLSWWGTYSPERSPWAPDITKVGSTYYMYYAVSSFGSNKSAIGLATSSTGAPGSFSDKGIVYSTSTSSDHNAIDPDLLVDSDGRWWMTFGSWWTGIKVMELNPATGKRLNSSMAGVASASGGIEGPTMVKNGGYYYLFSSYGKCCAGTSSTYSIRVGRSTKPTGPFTDRSGKALTAGGGTPVLETHDRIIGPGGQDVLHDSDGDLLVYHYYDGNDNGTPKLGVNLMSWSGGWPTVY